MIAPLMMIANNAQIPMNLKTGKFDRSLLNPIQLGDAISEIESLLDEIEKLDELDKIKKLYKEEESLQKFSLIGMLLFVCIVGIVIFCFANFKIEYLSRKLCELLQKLKEKAGEIAVKYNSNLNSRGKHATAGVNDIFFNKNGGALHEIQVSRLFFIQIAFSQQNQGFQYNNF